jgi:hypothetical protein
MTRVRPFFREDGRAIDPAHDFTISCVEGRHAECLGWVAPLVYADQPCECDHDNHHKQRMPYVEALALTIQRR